MEGFRERKQWRINRYWLYEHGWKERPCTACNGSDYYDHDGSPKCGGCGGTGKEKYAGPKSSNPEQPIDK
jgi:hypothetical protein